MDQRIWPQNSGRPKMKYGVDIVFCIDATGSMRPMIDMVKRNIKRLPNDILRCAGEYPIPKEIDCLRLRAILVRDYLADRKYAMEATDFFKVPEQQELFNNIIQEIVVDGGGDEPEDGLEALAYAMSSDWQKPVPGKRKCRQIIVVLTDASTHPIGYAKESPYYDPKMPTRFETLSSWWGDGPEDTDAKMDYYSKRLLLFAPEAAWWTTIQKNWENVIHIDTNAGQGLQEQSYDRLIRFLVSNI